MYKLECKQICWICQFNKKCIIQKKREQEVKTIFAGTQNQQEVISE